MTNVEEIKRLLGMCNEEQRREIFRYLRLEFPIHPIEAKLNIEAEMILEAIHRASDLSLRGVRGLIAEAVFERDVLSKLRGWKGLPVEEGSPYDFLLDDGGGQVRIQVKMQRQEKHRPKVIEKGLPESMFVVETQRTRTGTVRGTQTATRPYRFGEFDILAVSMQPSTGDWTSFMYTLASQLLPRLEDKSLLRVMQPVPKRPEGHWTDDIQTCIASFRSSQRKRIRGAKR